MEFVLFKQCYPYSTGHLTMRGLDLVTLRVTNDRLRSNDV